LFVFVFFIIFPLFSLSFIFPLYLYSFSFFFLPSRRPRPSFS
jgi:hypothetical protein